MYSTRTLSSQWEPFAFHSHLSLMDSFPQGPMGLYHVHSKYLHVAADTAVESVSPSGHIVKVLFVTVANLP